MTREEAIERIKIHMLIHRMAEDRAVYITKALNMAIEALKGDVSDTNVGEWIIVTDSRGQHAECPFCGEWKYHQNQKFCGECGCKMEVER